MQTKISYYPDQVILAEINGDIDHHTAKQIRADIDKAILEKDGLKEIKALNEKFDPNFHQAMSKEKRDGIEPGIVIEVIQTGYMYKDRLLRPAMVKVSE